MRAASIRNYAIFADGPELFAYLECDDWGAALETLARSDANRRWQELMSGYLATPVDPDAAAPLQLLEEGFGMEEELPGNGVIGSWAYRDGSTTARISNRL